MEFKASSSGTSIFSVQTDGAKGGGGVGSPSPKLVNTLASPVGRNADGSFIQMGLPNKQRHTSDLDFQVTRISVA